ncbi:MAG: hypothetical protein SVV03_02585 [Candidatus Nanohaloarchaea archaeon]|nr:hypothetical protein [Candidatus Nanohaloarchaea archaeon]
MIKVTEDHWELARGQDGIKETQEEGLFVLEGVQKLRAKKAECWYIDLRNDTFNFYGYTADGDPVEPPITPKPVKELKSHIRADGSSDLNQFV